MATFFGEVNELSSRSAWWSDSDSDDDENNDKNNNRNYQKSDIFKLIYNNNNNNVNLSELKFETIYLCNVKSLPKNLKTILSISINKNNNTICNLNVFNNENNQHQCWITINDRILMNQEYLTVQFVDYLFEMILNKIIINNDNKTKLIIISKQRNNNNNNYIQYLQQSSNDYIDELKKNFTMKKLMSPETSNNELELALMQYCIIKCLKFLFFILPNEFINNNNSNDDLIIFPKIIIDTLNQFYDFSQNNLII